MKGENAKKKKKLINQTKHLLRRLVAHSFVWVQTTIIMLLHKPGDIYILSFYNMFTKRPFHRWKTQLWEPWTVPGSVCHE